MRYLHALVLRHKINIRKSLLMPFSQLLTGEIICEVCEGALPIIINYLMINQVHIFQIGLV